MANNLIRGGNCLAIGFKLIGRLVLLPLAIHIGLISGLIYDGFIRFRPGSGS